MKKITVIAAPNAKASYQTVTVSIAAQTHRGELFGNPEGKKEFYASNGVVLKSDGRPAYYEKGATTNKPTLTLLGSDMARDKDTVEVPVLMWPKFEAAINEYNAFFKKKEVRHISCTIEPDAASKYQKVKLTITGQTHRREQFGDCEKGYGFKASNGVLLYSSDSPQFGYSQLLYVRGTNISNDALAILIPVENIGAIKQAIKEYNAKFAAPEAPVVKAKTLKISAEPVKATGYQTVKVTLLGQSDFGVNFGTKKAISAVCGEFIHPNGIRIASTDYMVAGFANRAKFSGHSDKELVGTMYVAFKSSDLGRSFEVPVEVWPLIEAAVTEYNKKFAAPAPKMYVERTTDNNNSYEVVGMVAEVLKADTHRTGWTSVKLPNGKETSWLTYKTKVVAAPVIAEERTDAFGCTYVG